MALKAVVVIVLSALAVAAIWYTTSLFGPGSIGEPVQVVYRGAVLEMQPSFDPNLTPVENMLENVKIMSEYGRLAKDQGADIIVFPEYGTHRYVKKTRQGIFNYSQYVPEVSSGVAPCDLDTAVNHDEVVREMSCTAKSLSMYIVFNLPERVDCSPSDDPECPNDHYYFYNINVVYDRRGVIISKWRKIHLFEEKFLNVGNYKDEAAIFTTDFGVKFSQQICFEIVFYRPGTKNIEKYGIRDFTMPTSWVDYLPLATAPQMQYGWSRGNNVNLLVAGIHVPKMGAVGSGIFTGATDVTNSIYFYDDTIGRKLLVHDVSTISTVPNIQVSPKTPLTSSSEFGIKQQPSRTKVSESHRFLEGYKFQDYAEFYFRESISGDSSGTKSGIYTPPNEPDVTVEYSIDWTLEGEGDYVLMVYSGPTGFKEYIVYNQVGALVYCPKGASPCGKVPVEKPEKATFQHLNLTMHFDVPYHLPTVIDQDFSLIGEDKWQYITRKEGGKYITSLIITEPVDFIYSAALVARWYDKDPICETKVC